MIRLCVCGVGDVPLCALIEFINAQQSTIIPLALKGERQCASVVTTALLPAPEDR